MDDFHEELVKEAQVLRDKFLEDSELKFTEHFKMGNEVDINDNVLSNPLAELLGMNDDE